jgi:hypothetical protein
MGGFPDVESPHSNLELFIEVDLLGSHLCLAADAAAHEQWISAPQANSNSCGRIAFAKQAG